MSEAIALIVGLALLSLFANLLSASKGSGNVEQDVAQPIEHIVTIWKERDGSAPPPVADSPKLAPRRVSVEYSVTIDADSAEQLTSRQAESVAAANEEFRRQFGPFLT